MRLHSQSQALIARVRLMHWHCNMNDDDASRFDTGQFCECSFHPYAVTLWYLCIPGWACSVLCDSR